MSASTKAPHRFENWIMGTALILAVGLVLGGFLWRIK